MKQENYLKKVRKTRAPDKPGRRNKGTDSFERWNWSKNERRNGRRENVRMRELEWW